MINNISTTNFLKTVNGVAQHFGFKPLETVKKARRVSNSKRIGRRVSAADRKIDSLHGILTGGVCSYFDGRLHTKDSPLSFYSLERAPRSGELAVSLQVMNVEKSIAENLLIQTMRSMLSELGYINHTVRVNSLGDEESSIRYAHDLTNFLRGRLNEMSVTDRALMKEHACWALMNMIKQKDDLIQYSPNPLEYLSDQSRKHFREVVEYLEMSDIPYEIDNKLIRHNNCYSGPLFTFDLQNDDVGSLDKQPITAQGGRYDTFVRRKTNKKVAAVGGVIILHNRKAPTRLSNAPRKTKPAVFVVQLGHAAKMKSLMLVDSLRQARISIRQDIVEDSLSAQLQSAKQTGLRYVIILGQQEFIKGTFILRDMHALNQETLSMNQLLRKLKKAL